MKENGPGPSYQQGPADKPLIEKTVGSFFDEVVSRYEDREALVSRHQGFRFTYAQLRERVDEFAVALLGFGVQKGDRVGIWSPNNAEWVMTQFATAKVGAILVNVNPAYRVQELEYALNQSGISLLVTAKQFKTSDYHWMITELAPEIRKFPKIGPDQEIKAARVPALRRVVTLSNGGEPSPSSMLPWERFIDIGTMNSSPAELREREKTLECYDAINIQYTSGTTGFPKDATLTHYGILNNGFFVGEGMNFTHHDRLCIPVPFYHCFGMVLGNLACVTHGATMVLPSDAFSAETVLRTVEEEKCTALHGVPTMFIAELDHPNFREFNLSTLRTGIMAGSPCPVEVIEESHIGYGHTRDHYLLWDDGNLSSLIPNPHRRLTGTPGHDGRASPPPCRSKNHRPVNRPNPTMRNCGRALRSRVPRDAQVLEQSRSHSGSH